MFGKLIIVIFLGDFSWGKYNDCLSEARVSACMYFLGYVGKNCVCRENAALAPPPLKHGTHDAPD
jgi:hypothetical protein